MVRQQSSKPATNQADGKDPKTGKFVKGNKPKTSFADRPQDRSNGGWKKEMVFSYQYKRFMNMTVTELRQYTKKPDNKRTVVEDLAYARVVAARKSLLDVKEITDRTEGKPAQSIDHTSLGDKIEPVIIYRPEKLDDADTQT